MEMRHFRYFAAVAATRSFSRASEKLNIAQPPLSRQIQQLEEELGVRLLNRDRPITLTEAGRHFYEQAVQVLARVEEIKSTTQRIGKGTVSQFTIGFVASTLYDALPELIRRFRIKAPGVEVTLSEMTTLEQAAALKDGRIDVGFGRLRFDDEGIKRVTIRKEKIVIAVPSGNHLISFAEPLKLRHIVGEPLIIYPKAPRPSYADQVLSFFRDSGLEPPKAALEVRELQTALGLVAAGVGICLVPSSVRNLGRADVIYLELDEPKVVSPIIMSHRKNDRSPLLAQLVKLVREFDKWEAPPAG
jgi:DNA-binding transcriptional LysR family regulator